MTPACRLRAGEGVCRACGRPIEDGRRIYACSPECNERYWESVRLHGGRR